MAKRRGSLHLGTSGWHYASWWGPFFPRALPKKDALSFYVSRFNAVELNAPFYRTPTPEAVAGWRTGSPAGFRFAWKASKFITHWKRLLPSTVNSLALLEDRIARLGDKAGPVLYQLPPRMTADRDRLAGFLDLVPPHRPAVFEFRHPSWYADPIFALLEERKAALCISDHADAPAPWLATSRLVYIRGHGPSGRYHGSYKPRALAAWAARMTAWRAEGRDIWCFFDNDVKSAAPRDAARLAALLD